jgi:DNA-binding MarR family transcriptional regulator
LKTVSKSGSKAEAEASLIHVVGRLNQGIRREMRTGLRELGLSVQEYSALAILRARPGLSNAELARRALVAPQSMLEILAKLEHRGLARRSVDPGHGRILRAVLTPAGHDLLARADPAIEAIQDRLFEHVSPRTRRIVLEGMLSAVEQLADPPDD